MSAPLLPQLQYLTPNELAALGEFLARLREKFGETVKHVWLFGSKAHGDFDEESDIDLLIVTADYTPEFERESNRWAVGIGLEYEIVLSDHIIDLNRFEQMHTRREPLYTIIQNEGIDLWKLALIPAI